MLENARKLKGWEKLHASIEKFLFYIEKKHK